MAFALDGDLPVNPDGGSKSFGHPVGVRPADDVRGVAPAAPRGTPERQLTADRTLALTHNLGGYPGEMVAFVSVVGSSSASGRGTRSIAARRTPRPPPGRRSSS